MTIDETIKELEEAKKVLPLGGKSEVVVYSEFGDEETARGIDVLRPESYVIIKTH